MTADIRAVASGWIVSQDPPCRKATLNFQQSPVGGKKGVRVPLLRAIRVPDPLFWPLFWAAPAGCDAGGSAPDSPEIFRIGTAADGARMLQVLRTGGDGLVRSRAVTIRPMRQPAPWALGKPYAHRVAGATAAGGRFFLNILPAPILWLSSSWCVGFRSAFVG